MLASLKTSEDAGELGLTPHAEWWRGWLFDQALPVWAEHGLNPRGGFFDRLTPDLRAPEKSMRLRVQGRQVFVFAEAGRLGWAGDWRRIVEHGLAFLLERATLSDGLVASQFAADGSVEVSGPDLYDQSFALLAYASAYAVIGDERARTAAHALAEALAPYRAVGGGYRELDPAKPLLNADPQMHLFEAALAWRAADDHPLWRAMTDELAALCEERLVDPGTGVLREVFVEGWAPAPPPLGERTAPGHHFEWAWLLGAYGAGPALPRRLARRAESAGVDPARGVAVNALDPAGRVLDGSARLWPQAERLRAALMLRREEGWLRSALSASEALSTYLHPTAPGLWGDVMDENGLVDAEPARASSLYHLVGAISEFITVAKMTA